ncbi:cryptochrome/deoxyribodipyrimidine photo-lyase family protein [Actibacterium sp. MT2.3-13A]|uniref:cryptochrome/deoxyribodipyrimidine photo-lyase family protein n=1 Tax=Actibacterium sp. MT2.3-13A TaxID=2828332 RepID=UPI001BA88A0B|nr:cryptochrome/deoxyribodipyrimidine photo-lyase family protein [Actibacterium sp. MT2.3-13A]
MTVTILWFKRDLRLFDHPALACAAAGEGAVLPLYIVEPGYWAQPDTSARQWRFTAECLEDLAAGLAALGAPLQVEVGEAVEVLRKLAAARGVARFVSHEATGNAWTHARDRRVAAWARAAGVEWVELPQSGVVRGLASRDGWARARAAWLGQPTAAAPQALRAVPGLGPCPIPEARDLALRFDPCPGRQRGGRARGLEAMGGFLEGRGPDDHRALSMPAEGKGAPSRLSPHLALGALSGREVAQAVAARRRVVRGQGDGWPGRLRSFGARLALRDHLMQKLEEAPIIERRCLHPAYENLRPATPDAARLAAWQKGETGLPLVDACMRALTETGWLDFRMRAMLVSVASYHLWLDWRATGAHLARLFTDYEPGIHWPQMQMQSGTTGMEPPRVCDPVKQARAQDPAGAFTRRWLPELDQVPDAFLQQPWLWPGAGRLLGRAYPEPVVDVAQAGRAARDRALAVRRGDAFRAEAARHAGRKPAPRPRAPRARADGQLSFDL